MCMGAILNGIFALPTLMYGSKIYRSFVLLTLMYGLKSWVWIANKSADYEISK